MGYYLRESPEVLDRLGILAAIWYAEKFEEDPRESFVDEAEQIVTVIGNHKIVYTFRELFGY